MTDSPILTPAELDARLSAIRRQGTGEPVPGRPRDAIHAHDAALRAALAAAEERAAEAEAKAHHFDNQCVDNWREVIRLREELADQRERIGAWSAEWSAKLAAAEERAERAEQTAEAQMTIVYAAEAQVRTLREALIDILNIEFDVNRSAYAEADAIARAALRENNDGT